MKPIVRDILILVCIAVPVGLACALLLPLIPDHLVRSVLGAFIYVMFFNLYWRRRSRSARKR